MYLLKVQGQILSRIYNCSNRSDVRSPMLHTSTTVLSKQIYQVIPTTGPCCRQPGPALGMTFAVSEWVEVMVLKPTFIWKRIQTGVEIYHCVCAGLQEKRDRVN